MGCLLDGIIELMSIFIRWQWHCACIENKKYSFSWLCILKYLVEKCQDVLMLLSEGLGKWMYDRICTQAPIYICIHTHRETERNRSIMAKF